MAIDFKNLKHELLLAVRGGLSQGQLNKKMKFNSNQIYRWESGQATISWREFCALCRATKKPLDKAARQSLAQYGKPEDVPAILDRLLTLGNQSQMAKKAGVSRSVMSRWKSGKAEPSLEQIMKLIDGSGVSLTSFVTQLVDASLLPAVQEDLALEEKERALHFKYPWVGGVILCMRTPIYKALKTHREGFISEHIGISMEEERLAVRELEAAGAIYKVDGVYHPRLSSIALTGNREGNVRLRRYWTERCMARLEQPPTGQPLLWPYMIFNVDQKTYDRIFKKVLALWEEIHELSDMDTVDGNGIYLFNLQLLDLGKLPGGIPSDEES